ncbi:MAG TPA: DUF885 domain-containing protein [Candidatus Limnocylindrales bacterium]|nr:DUF885 domain-containing protein [Candidatus Limnocylindrales bacterium]
MVSVSEVSDRYITEMAELDPVRGERWGVKSDGTRLTDYSPDGFEALTGLLRKTQAAVDAATASSEPERLGAGFLHDWVKGEADVIGGGERERWLNIITGPPASTRSVFDLMDHSSVHDWELIRARLRAVPKALDGYRQTLQIGLDEGRPAARRQAIAVAEQCATWAGRNGDGGWFGTFVAGFDPLASGKNGAAPLQGELGAAAVAASKAYGSLSEWLRTDYASKATEVDGVGDERYLLWARFLLGAELDIDEAYEWGWQELARLEAEKAVEVERIKPSASFLEVRELLSTDPRRLIEGVEAYRQWLQYVTDESIAGLDGREFDIDPSIRQCNVRIPPEGSAAAAYYTPPSEDLSRPGQTWFPTVGRTRFPTWDDVSTVYHEAVPGHHLQGATIKLVPLTRAHKLGFISAHGEGWALYAERLMDELGWFRTPETRLGFLCAHAMRAARVVVDIGLHTGRRVPDIGARLYPDWAGAASRAWEFDGAVDFMVRAGGLSLDSSTSEVNRYLSWPSQATAYKLGERAWLAGRQAARERAASEGREFDRKAWHRGALALGPLGLDRLVGELARV